jgi:hypothetical protein
MLCYSLKALLTSSEPGLGGWVAEVAASPYLKPSLDFDFARR